MTTTVNATSRSVRSRPAPSGAGTTARWPQTAPTREFRDRRRPARRCGADGRVRWRRTKPSRRALQRTTPKVVEQLGPAPVVYYVIVVVVAVFVMLGLVMVLSATSANKVGGDRVAV